MWLSKKNIIWLLILILLTLISSRAAYHMLHDKQEKTAVDVTKPDAFANALKVKQMDVSGKPHMTLATPRINHYPNGVVVLSDPIIVVHVDNGTPWHVTADYAQALQGSNAPFYLWGHVKIQRAASGKNPAITVTTPAINYDPTTKLAVTSQEITLVESGNRMQAVGAHANLALGKFDLLANVRGEYVQQGQHSNFTP